MKMRYATGSSRRLLRSTTTTMPPAVVSRRVVAARASAKDAEEAKGSATEGSTATLVQDVEKKKMSKSAKAVKRAEESRRRKLEQEQRLMEEKEAKERKRQELEATSQENLARIAASPPKPTAKILSGASKNMGRTARIRAEPKLRDNVDAYTEWRTAQASLKKFGLKSVEAKEAFDLVSSGKAVLIDVRLDQTYIADHADPSENVGYYKKAKGYSGKRVFLGSKSTIKNEDFVKEVKEATAGGKTVILCCSTGGSITVERKEKDGRSYEDSLADSQRAFGRDSLSLRAANDLIQDGVTDILHLSEGFPGWRAAGLPCTGSVAVRRDREAKVAAAKKDKEARKAARPAERRPKVLGLYTGSKSFAVWPVVFQRLSDFGPKSVTAIEAKEMAESGKAVIVDVRPNKRYVKKHIAGSVNVPLYKAIQGNKSLGNLRNFFTGSFQYPTERDADFAEAVGKAVGKEGKMIILSCGAGGSLDTFSDKLDKNGDRIPDRYRKYGIESTSLTALDELIQAGYTNVAHLEGGDSSWNFMNLPVEGKRLTKPPTAPAFYIDDDLKYGPNADAVRAERAAKAKVEVDDGKKEEGEKKEEEKSKEEAEEKAEE